MHDAPRPPVWHSVALQNLYGALNSHPFCPSHAASGQCFLMAAAACVLCGVLSASAGPSSWRSGGCAGCCGGRFTVFVAHSPRVLVAPSRMRRHGPSAKHDRTTESPHVDKALLAPGQGNGAKLGTGTLHHGPCQASHTPSNPFAVRARARFHNLQQPPGRFPL